MVKRPTWAERLFRLGSIPRLGARLALCALILAIAVGVGPALAQLFLGKLLYSSLACYVPGPPDPMMYWHEAGSFFRAGFAHGYYGMNEMTPLLGSAWHHGPWYVALYGGLARLGGQWTYTTGVTLNFLLVGLACLAYAALTGARPGLLALLAAFMASFHYLLLYQCSNWSESLLFAVALVLAGLWSALFSLGPGDRRYRPLKALTFACLTYAALLRHSFGLLYFVFFFLEKPGTARRAAIQAGKALACLAGCMALYGATRAPFVTAFTGGDRLLQGLARGDASLLLATVKANFEGLGEQYPLYSLLLVEALALGLCATAVAWLESRREPGQDGRAPYVLMLESALHAVNLLGVAALLAVYYVVYGPWGYRVLGPHLTLSLFVYAASRRAVLPWALIGLNLLALPFGLHVFTLDRMAEYYDTAALKVRLAEASRDIEGRMAYRPGLDRWCNTVLYSGYGRYLLSVPLGIGCQFYSGQGPLDTVRSRYLAGSSFSQDMSLAPFHFRLLGRMGPQGLYENEGGACPP
ncbi:hypothetical protein JCM15519_25540 [Fundidesulfovibrio butyratiphilus]